MCCQILPPPSQARMYLQTEATINYLVLWIENVQLSQWQSRTSPLLKIDAATSGTFFLDLWPQMEKHNEGCCNPPSSKNERFPTRMPLNPVATWGHNSKNFPLGTNDFWISLWVVAVVTDVDAAVSSDILAFKKRRGNWFCFYPKLG